MLFWPKVFARLPEAIGVLVVMGVLVGLVWAVRAPHRSRQLVVLSTALCGVGLFAAGLGAAMHSVDLYSTWQLQQIPRMAESLARNPIATGWPWRFGLAVAALAWGVGLTLLSVGLRRLRLGALPSEPALVGGGR
jgi:hypothetical protein